MAHVLDAETLMEHVRALADGIGPRPPGAAAHPAEAAGLCVLDRIGERSHGTTCTGPLRPRHTVS